MSVHALAVLAPAMTLALVIAAPILAARTWHRELSEEATTAGMIGAGVGLAALAVWIALRLVQSRHGRASPWQAAQSERLLAYLAFAITGAALLAGALSLVARRRRREGLRRAALTFAFAVTVPAVSLLCLVALVVLAGE